MLLKSKMILNEQCVKPQWTNKSTFCLKDFEWFINVINEINFNIKFTIQFFVMFSLKFSIKIQIQINSFILQESTVTLVSELKHADFCFEFSLCAPRRCSQLRCCKVDKLVLLCLILKFGEREIKQLEKIRFGDDTLNEFNQSVECIQRVWRKFRIKLRIGWLQYVRWNRNDVSAIGLLLILYLIDRRIASYALIGPSGCGKTTVIKSLIGLTDLECGTVEIIGAPPKVNNFRIGYMPQEAALINEFTSREIVWFFGKIYGMTSNEIDKKYESLSMLLELPSDEKMIGDCSGGEKRRISFALTLVHDPDVLILDEPTVGLDPVLRTKIWSFLTELTTIKNKTILMSTHYIDEANRSHRIGLMRNGVQVAEDSPRKIISLMESESLEEAFLKLCLNQHNQVPHRKRDENILPEISETFIESKKQVQSNSLIMTALLRKSYLQIIRNVWWVF